MDTGWKLDGGYAKARLGVLAAVLLGAAATLPANASADGVIVPHASAPQEVEPHPVRKGAPPNPAPPSLPPAPSDSGGSGEGPVIGPRPPEDSGIPEGDLPGAEVPRGDEPVYPGERGFPHWSSDECKGICQQVWGDWYLARSVTVLGEGDRDAYEQLQEELKTINATIIAEGGVPGEDPGEGGLNIEQGLGPGNVDSPGPGDSSQSGTVKEITETVEVIFGSVTFLDGTPVDGSPVDLGTWDLSGLADVADMVSGHWLVDAINQIINGSTTCPKDSPDDEVALCTN